MSKVVLLVISLVVVLGTAYFVYTTNNKPSMGYKPGSWYEGDKAINQAERIYQEKKVLGEDFTDGPCLSNDLYPGWVADMVHSPRQPVDDLAENQCPAFIEGRATHYVELDSAGSLIRVQ
jgi:hypothetical protein